MSGLDPATMLASVAVEGPGHRSGKVRESWALPGDRRLLVTTDRISAFDRVFGTIPNKGQVLNQLAAWWFDRTADVVDNHVISVPDPNVLIAIDATPLPVEVVVRARLTGSTDTALLPRYEQGERVLYGHHLPDGLAPHGALPEPIITPTTKAADGGHDQPITCAEVTELGLVETELWAEIQKVALAVFARGVEVAAAAGFILADTKYEFGLAPDGRLLLIDEVHTPDSSRYWDVEHLERNLAEGEGPPSFDKEPFRLALKAAGYVDGGPDPDLSDRVRTDTGDRYVELYERLTGLAFEPGAQPVEARVEASIRSALQGAG
ncbi:MAG: phosphoribosylaminoimidazolesuccinocarboxamide synthase [Actinomycetota bacterium]